MLKLSRRVVAAAAATLAVGAGSAAAGPASAATVAPARHASTPRCTPGHLAAWVDADSADGTAGTNYFHLDLTNTGRTTCYLNGWPTVTATNGAGKQLGLPAVRNPAAPAKNVQVTAGGTAHALLGYVDVKLSKACQPTAATFLKVYAPGTTGARHAYFPMSVCTTNVSMLTIGRVQSGA